MHCIYKMAQENKLFHTTEIQQFKKIVEEIVSIYNERLCVVNI